MKTRKSILLIKLIEVNVSVTDADSTQCLTSQVELKISPW